MTDDTTENEPAAGTRGAATSRFVDRPVIRPFRWYGANPLHLLALLACFALAGYAGIRLFEGDTVGIAVWFVGAAVGHDLLLLPLYAIADRSVQGVLRHRASPLPPAPWINYLRVPVVISGVLLLVYFPLIFGLTPIYPAITALPVSGYLGRWLLITGVLFAASALAFAISLARRRRMGARR